MFWRVNTVVMIYLCLLLASGIVSEETMIPEVLTESQPVGQLSNDKPHLNCKGTIIAEKEYVILQNGSLLLPGSQDIHDDGSYMIENETAYLCMTSEELKAVTDVESSTVYNFSEEFLNCGHVLIETEEFLLMKNRTVFVEIYRKYYEPTEYYMLEGTGVYVCAPNYEVMHFNMTNTTIPEISKFSSAFTYVSVIGLFISIISLILHLIVFCCISKVRNLPGCCLASLSLSLLLAYLCFLSSAVAPNKEQCAGIGIAVYYFFLTSFFWMNTIAFDVWRSFRVVVRKMRISSHRVPWRKFLLYSMYSWVIPAILAILAALSDKTDLIPEEFRPSFGSSNCWFGKRKALLVFFALPLCVVMVLNAIFFMDSTYVINVATIKNTASVNDLLLRRRFFMFMRLALLMGLTWIIGIIAGYVDQPVLWYVFVILNTLQGLFIFVVFSCSSKVRMLLHKRLQSRSKSYTSTSVRTVSQMSNAL